MTRSSWPTCGSPAYRRPWLLPAGLADAVLAAFRPGDTLAALAYWTVLAVPRALSAPRCCGCYLSGGLSPTFTAASDGDSVLEAADG